jgi:hypothetical protein
MYDLCKLSPDYHVNKLLIKLLLPVLLLRLQQPLLLLVLLLLILLLPIQGSKVLLSTTSLSKTKLFRFILLLVSLSM